MIFEPNEDPIDLLAIIACPVDSQVDGLCRLRDEGVYNASCIATCRACWLEWLSKESEDNHE